VRLPCRSAVTVTARPGGITVSRHTSARRTPRVGELMRGTRRSRPTLERDQYTSKDELPPLVRLTLHGRRCRRMAGWSRLSNAIRRCAYPRRPDCRHDRHFVPRANANEFGAAQSHPSRRVRRARERRRELGDHRINLGRLFDERRVVVGRQRYPGMQFPASP
jgi:hypothetical protein